MQLESTSSQQARGPVPTWPTENSLWDPEQVGVGQRGNLEGKWKISSTLFQVQIIILFNLMTLYFGGSGKFIKAILKFWHYKYWPWYFQHRNYINIPYQYILLLCFPSLNMLEGQLLFCSVFLLFVMQFKLLWIRIYLYKIHFFTSKGNFLGSRYYFWMWHLQQ